MRVLGLKLWRDRPTDEEYIEQLRKSIRIHRWLRWFHALVGLAMPVLCIWAIGIFSRILTTPGTPSQQQSLVYLTFGAAMVLGFTLGFWLAHAVLRIVSAFIDPRKDRMLVECWDMLNALLDESDGAANPQPR